MATKERLTQDEQEFLGAYRTLVLARKVINDTQNKPEVKKAHEDYSKAQDKLEGLIYNYQDDGYDEDVSF